MGTTGRWLASGLLLTITVAVMVVNKLTVCSWMRRRNPAATVSVIGGLLGAFACSVSPSSLMKSLWWAPTALDVIGAPYLLILAWIGIQEALRKNRSADAGRSLG